MGQTKFQRSDAWIFVSLAFYQGNVGTSLRDLIATADYINHAIPNADEVEGAINRLSGAGLVIVEDNCFYLTGAGRTLLHELRAKRPSLLQTWALVEERLLAVEFPELEVPAFKLEPAQFEDAKNSYLDLISNTKEKTKRKKKLPQ
jgi:hypothetical protein